MKVKYGTSSDILKKLFSLFQNRLRRCRPDTLTVLYAGREEPDSDDQLLADSSVDRLPPDMEQLRLRWNSENTGALLQGLEA